MTILGNCRGHRTANWLYGLTLALMLSIVAPMTASASVVVIVNDDVSEGSLSKTDIRQIFTGHRQFWRDGSRIRVFVLDNNAPAHKTFCRETLKMFPYQLERLWNQITYSGQGEPPVRLDSQQALINAVLETPGAIGYAEEGMFSNAKSLEVNSQ
ncbi:hypothetical protein [Alteromonas halophila]|uniref:PBP domain-containing protein n=1 Tax=Alteromonas halophila TaxID=516698 RepID=A0A918JJX8_9ALTE|nr:hypothetical protein [Alteromonas halophila]GGW85145.1 hypothetical protein GCM10007391_18770 [Alteromonas halophila]